MPCRSAWGWGSAITTCMSFSDQTQMVDPSTNPTLPGRIGDNINEDDAKAIREIARDLVRGAEICDVDEEFVFNSVKANYLAKKLMAKLDCNAFTAPCPDMCATRRLNEEQFTLCLQPFPQQRMRHLLGMRVRRVRAGFDDPPVEPVVQRPLHGQYVARENERRRRPHRVTASDEGQGRFRADRRQAERDGRHWLYLPRRSQSQAQRV